MMFDFGIEYAALSPVFYAWYVKFRDGKRLWIAPVSGLFYP